jgi:hypothetical protein
MRTQIFLDMNMKQAIILKKILMTYIRDAQEDEFDTATNLHVELQRAIERGEEAEKSAKEAEKKEAE